MSTLISAVAFVPMARKEQAAKTEQVNFRLKVSTIERMEAFRERHQLHPTLTQIVEASVKAYLDQHEPDLAPKPRHK